MMVAKSLMRSMLGGSLEGEEEEEDLQRLQNDDHMDVDEDAAAGQQPPGIQTAEREQPEAASRQLTAAQK